MFQLHMLRTNLPKIIITNGSLEFLKWFALILMTGDHVNTYLFNQTIPLLNELGRIAMPLFVFILAYNLARDEVDLAVFKRISTRLFIFGCISLLPKMLLGHLVQGWWPLNIMFTLCALTISIGLLKAQYKWASELVIFLAGFFVEFMWPALLFGLCTYLYAKKPSYIILSGSFLTCLGICLLNNSLWALLVYPLVLVASIIDLGCQRTKWFFYVYYPLHFLVIFAVQEYMRSSGYLII